MSESVLALPPFIHLHVHSEYSLMDGAIRITDMVQKAKDLGHTAIALTDHTNMFGAVEFYTACKGAGINPIIGCEIFHEGLPSTIDLVDTKTPGLDGFHLTLLAKTTKGYHSLMRIVSYGYLRSKSAAPIVCGSDLDQETEDLFALSSCLRGEFGRLVAKFADIEPNVAAFDKPSKDGLPILKALNLHVKTMIERFGSNHYFIEIIDNNLSKQKELIPWLVAAARHYGLPLVATADAHYLDKDFSEAHAVLTSVKNDLTMSKIRERRKDVTFHLLDNEEMLARFSEYPDALSNTLLIADQCEVKLTFGEFFLPEFDLNGEDINDALKRISKEGLKERLNFINKMAQTPLTQEQETVYWDRLDYELNVIVEMGFPGYFLIVQDFINWAKDHDIPVGPGRGSGAGSIVAYALRITDLDPIPLNLIFERFLNPERISMPDFDVDFCQSRRDEVIHYVAEKYGKSNVAQITTFGKMKAKAAVRDVGRVLEMGYTRVDRIAKLIPNELDIKLQDAIDQEPRLMEEAKKDPLVDDLLKIALQVEGLSRHTSVHAAGVVISNGPMENFVPVYKAEDEGSLITQYEMKNAEKVGLVKFDFLGLKTLTVVHKAVEIVRKSLDPEFAIEFIDLEDPKVYEQVSLGHTCAIFQLESSGMQALNIKLKPSCFEDIIAVVALFRPGPLGSGMVDDFIERKHGKQEITYPLPQLEPILKDTYGIILYQEQVQKIAAVLANYSLGEADLLRRAMGKKKPEEMAKQKSRFLAGAAENKIDTQVADDVFELMSKFAAYGFNKSHSAAYGLVSYQTAFLKTHFPAEFMAAIMTCDLDNTDKLIRYIEECHRLKFKIIAPSLNQSHLEFTVPDRTSICFALTAIKGIGTAPLIPIIEDRTARGPYKNLTELAKRVNLHKVGKKTLELMTEAGCFDEFEYSRSTVTKCIPDMVKYSENHHSAKISGQQMLFMEEADDTSQFIAEWETSMKKEPDWSPSITWLLKEKKILGVFLSRHPCDVYKEDRERFGRLKIANIPKVVGQKNQPIVCFMSSYSERLTKSGKKMAYVNIEDSTGSVEAVMFQNEIPSEFPPLNTMIVAYASISKSYDGQSINCRLEKMVPLGLVREEMTKSAKIFFKVDTSFPQNTKDLVHKVYGLTRQSPGKTPFTVTLRFPEGEVTIKPENNTFGLNEGLYGDLTNLDKSIDIQLF